MQTFDPGKKVFFLYPPHDFSKNIISRLFKAGFEIYILNRTDALLPVLSANPDSILVINTDYPYENMDFNDLNSRILNQAEFAAVKLYTIFHESVGFGEKVIDYIALNRNDDEVFNDLHRLLTEAGAHGKREYVRYGDFNGYLSTISFEVEGEVYSEGMHDISPKALSFSSEKDLEHLVSKDFSNMKLKVGVYEITVQGKIELSRTIGGKKIYIAVFSLNEEEKENIFNFIFTSLEKGMDDFIQNIDGI
ncbi:MAG: hypothetical protein PQJ58_04240 [Spirochaetales bacterium]|nr:hypothetical protein [Spirochaetales bacterium]